MVGKCNDEGIESDGEDERTNAYLSIEKTNHNSSKNVVKALVNFSLFLASDKIRSPATEISKLIESKLLNSLRQVSVMGFFLK